MSSFLEAYEKINSLRNLNNQPLVSSQRHLRASLKRTRAFFAALGHPEKKLKFIHVAGTSGKGSTAHLTHQMIYASGASVGTYVSPHTTSYLERFLWGDELADADKMAACMNDMLEIYERFLATSEPLSFFELSTCLAVYSFHKMGAQWCVLEAGLGGRWDATNVIPTPEVAIITNINKDHTNILGDSLKKIASAKAGIIKNGGTVLCGEMRPSLKKVFTSAAIKKNAALFFVPPPNEPLVPVELGLGMQHNAALASRTAKEIGIDDTVIDHVLKNPKRLPCRFETIQKNPTVILDGAHSPAKIKDTVERIKKFKKRVHVIFGCTITKDAPEMVALLAPVIETFTTTRFPIMARKAANPAELLALAPRTRQSSYHLEWKDALGAVMAKAKKDDIVLVTGSLYLAGDIRKHWISESSIIERSSSLKN